MFKLLQKGEGEKKSFPRFFLVNVLVFVFGQVSQFVDMELDNTMLLQNPFEFEILKNYLIANHINLNNFVTTELFAKLGQGGFVSWSFPTASS